MDEGTEIINLTSSLLSCISAQCSDTIDFDKCFKTISNIPIEIKEDGEGVLPKKLELQLTLIKTDVYIYTIE